MQNKKRISANSHFHINKPTIPLIQRPLGRAFDIPFFGVNTAKVTEA
jgi:hypothetical protein